MNVGWDLKIEQLENIGEKVLLFWIHNWGMHA